MPQAHLPAEESLLEAGAQKRAGTDTDTDTASREGPHRVAGAAKGGKERGTTATKQAAAAAKLTCSGAAKSSKCHATNGEEEQRCGTASRPHQSRAVDGSVPKKRTKKVMRKVMRKIMRKKKKKKHKAGPCKATIERRKHIVLLCVYEVSTRKDTQ